MKLYFIWDSETSALRRDGLSEATLLPTEDDIRPKKLIQLHQALTRERQFGPKELHLWLAKRSSQTCMFRCLVCRTHVSKILVTFTIYIRIVVQRSTGHTRSPACGDERFPRYRANASSLLKRRDTRTRSWPSFNRSFRKRRRLKQIRISTSLSPELCGRFISPSTAPLEKKGEIGSKGCPCVIDWWRKPEDMNHMC